MSTGEFGATGIFAGVPDLPFAQVIVGDIPAQCPE